MGHASFGPAIRQAHLLFEVGTAAGLSDRELLARFARREGEGAEAAFAGLVARHGPMVLRVGRAVLGDEHAAHDAFQATFLALALRAGSLRVGDSLGPWLHEVARRVALGARSASARRARHERRAGELSARSADGIEVDDIAPALHEELARLPEPFRAAVLLCDLEGLTQEQAAARLGWPLGTVRSRLARARERLRGRLARRGLAPTAVLVPTPPLPDAAVVAAARLAAGGEATLTVRLLADGGLRAMNLIRWKAATAAGLAVLLAATGAGLLARRSLGDDPRPAPTQPAAPAVPDGMNIQSSLVRIAPDGGKVWAYSAPTRAWRSYRTPPGVKVESFREPQRTVNVLFAPTLQGPEIPELAVYLARTGAWSIQRLKEPAKGSVNFWATGRFALFRVGRTLYGFSADTASWAVRDLGEHPDDGRIFRFAPMPWMNVRAAGYDFVPGPDGSIPKNPAEAELHAPGSFSYRFPYNDRMGLIRVGRTLFGFSVPRCAWGAIELDAQETMPYGTTFPGGVVLIPKGDHLFAFDAAEARFRDVETGEPHP